MGSILGTLYLGKLVRSYLFTRDDAHILFSGDSSVSIKNPMEVDRGGRGRPHVYIHIRISYIYIYICRKGFSVQGLDRKVVSPDNEQNLRLGENQR